MKKMSVRKFGTLIHIWIECAKMCAKMCMSTLFWNSTHNLSIHAITTNHNNKYQHR